jgi:acetate CoA/acetoacetate CoA-transferase alpha subunit
MNVGGASNMAKVIDINDAAATIKDSMTIMISGFWGIGSLETLIGKLVDKGVKGLTVIANDTAFLTKVSASSSLTGR